MAGGPTGTLNKKSASPFKKISDLITNKKYMIVSAEIKYTKFGRSVQFTVDEDGEQFKFFLPKRLSNIEELDLILYINNYIVYKGRGQVGFILANL